MKTVSLFTILLILPIISTAQWQFETAVHSSYDDNVNSNHEQIHDQVTQTQVGAGYDIESGRWNTQYFYLGSYHLYTFTSDRTFHFHSVGMTSTYYDDEYEVDLGGTYSLRANRAGFSFLDYRTTEAYLTYSASPWDDWMGTSGVRFNYLSFSELPELNNLEALTYVNLAHTFPTRTSIIAGGDLGMKLYQRSLTGSGMGRTMTSAGTQSAQTSAFLKVGQSVFERTGISGTVRYQRNLQSSTRFLISTYAVSDDEIFDSRYGYEGPSMEVLLKQLLPYSTAVEIGYGYADKRYIGIAAYDLLGAPIAPERHDYRSTISTVLKKGFDIGKGNIIAVSVMYDVIDNISNDQYYDYTNQVVALQISAGW